MIVEDIRVTSGWLALREPADAADVCGLVAEAQGL